MKSLLSLPKSVWLVLQMTKRLEALLCHRARIRKCALLFVPSFRATYLPVFKSKKKYLTQSNEVHNAMQRLREDLKELLKSVLEKEDVKKEVKRVLEGVKADLREKVADQSCCHRSSELQRLVDQITISVPPLVLEKNAMTISLEQKSINFIIKCGVIKKTQYVLNAMKLFMVAVDQQYYLKITRLLSPPTLKTIIMKNTNVFLMIVAPEIHLN